jgi:hypothetical protein
VFHFFATLLLSFRFPALISLTPELLVEEHGLQASKPGVPAHPAEACTTHLQGESIL